MAKKSKSKAIWDMKIVRGAIVDSLVKLDPRHMMGNPVMFVVEVGSVITTLLLLRAGTDFSFNLQITAWLWFTVLFAIFAEAMAEGRARRKPIRFAKRAPKPWPIACWKVTRPSRLPAPNCVLVI